MSRKSNLDIYIKNCYYAMYGLYLHYRGQWMEKHNKIWKSIYLVFHGYKQKLEFYMASIPFVDRLEWEGIGLYQNSLSNLHDYTGYCYRRSTHSHIHFGIP